MNILGISAYYHDSAACLVKDGEIIAAAQEERFTRKKHDASFPASAIAYCLREGGITVQEQKTRRLFPRNFKCGGAERGLHSGPGRRASGLIPAAANPCRWACRG